MFQSLRNTLWFKLTIAFLLLAVVGVSVVALLANQATARGFRRFLDEDQAEQWRGLQADLADLYASQGSWDGAAALLIAVRPGRGQGGVSLALLDSSGHMVASAGGRGNMPSSAENASVSLPISVGAQQAGILLVNEPGQGSTHAGEQFLTEVNRAIWWSGLVAVLLALFLGVFLARRLTEPIRILTQATRKLAIGQLAQQVSVDNQDELGELAFSFNQMSLALAMAEKQRQQLLADVAHELRTPLTVMRGHIEAMLDGVFETTPDNLALVHEETVLLARLIEDLRTLSLAESGQLSLERTPVNLAELTSLTIAAFEPLAEAESVRLTVTAASDMPLITVDPNRIRQVLGNLLSNALRHVVKGEKEVAEVWVSLEKREETVQVSIADNGPGLSIEAQQHAFDRFWRADNARSRETGGSGLGLAISQAIITVHNGRIWVESIPGEGATFIFELPTTLEVGD
jgi:signal transduction histidine kinase